MSPTVSKPDRLAREQLLLEYLRLLEPRKAGRRSVHVALSRLSPLNRRQSHLHLASAGLRRLSEENRGQLFHLVNDDLLFFHEVAAETMVNAELARLRTLFAEDPLMSDVEDAAAFARSYNLDSEFDAVVRLAQTASGTATIERQPGAATDGNLVKLRLRRRELMGRPVPPAVLPKLEVALARTDISSFVRRRPVLRLVPDAPTELAFTDLAISMAALSEALVPGFDLEADRAIAGYLADTLDRRILTMLLRQEPPQGKSHWPNHAVPLTLSTLVSESFRAFDAQISIMRRDTIVLKIGVRDIFRDLSAARLLFRLAHHRGYRIALLGLTPAMLPLFTGRGLGIDFVYCECTPTLLTDPASPSRLAEAVQRLAPARLLLTSTESEDALALGLRAGIELFQGRYAEEVARTARRRLLHLAHIRHEPLL